MKKRNLLVVCLSVLALLLSPDSSRAATDYTNWPAVQEWVDLTNDIKTAYDAYNERSMASWNSSSYNITPTYIYPYRDYSNLAVKIDQLAIRYVDITLADAGGSFAPYFIAHPTNDVYDLNWTVAGLHAAAGFTNWATNEPMHLWMSVDHAIQTQVVACLNLLTHTTRGSGFTSSGLANYRSVTATGNTWAQALTNVTTAWASATPSVSSTAELDGYIKITTNTAWNRWDASAKRIWGYMQTTGIWTGRQHTVDWYYGAWDESTSNYTFSSQGTSVSTNLTRLEGPTTYNSTVTSDTGIGYDVFSGMPSPVGSNGAGFTMHSFDTFTMVKWLFASNPPPVLYSHAEDPDTDRDDLVDPGADLASFGPDTGVMLFRADQDEAHTVLPLAATPAWYGGLPVYAYLAQGGTTNLPFQYLIPNLSDDDGPYQALSVRTRVLESGAVISSTRTNKLAAVLRPRGNVVIFDFPWDATASAFSPLGFPAGINSNRTYVLQDVTPTVHTDQKYNLYFESGIIHQFNGTITNVTGVEGLSTSVSTNSIPGASINFPTVASGACYTVTLAWSSGLVSQVSYASKDGTQTITASLSSDSSKKINGLTKSGVTGIEQSNASLSGNTITYGWGTASRSQTAPAGQARTVTLTTSFTDFGSLTEDTTFNAGDRPLEHEVSVSGNSASVTCEYDTASGRYANGFPKQAKLKHIGFPDGSSTDFTYDSSTGWLVKKASPVGNGLTRALNYGYASVGAGDPPNTTNLVERPRSITNTVDSTIIGQTLFAYSGATQTVMQQCTNAGAAWNDAGNLVTTNTYAVGGLTNGLLLSAKNPNANVLVNYAVAGLAGNTFTSLGRLSSAAVISTGVTRSNTVNAFGTAESAVVVDSDSGQQIESAVSSVDALGRIVSTAFHDGTSISNINWSLFGPAARVEVDGSQTTCEYYSEGSPKEMVRADTGITTGFEYDPLLNLTKMTETGADSATRTIAMAYDPMNRLLSWGDSLGITTFTYANQSFGTRRTGVLSDGSTVVEDRYMDGSLKEFSGSGALALARCEYGAESGQFYSKNIHVVGSAETEWTKSYRNLLGQTARIRHAGASADAVVFHDAQARFAGGVDEAGITSVMDYNTKDEPANMGLDQNADRILSPASSDRFITRKRSVSASGINRGYYTYPQVSDSTSNLLASLETSLDSRSSISTYASRSNQSSRSAYSPNGAYTETNTPGDGTRIVREYEKWLPKTVNKYGSDGVLWETVTFSHDGLGALSTIQHSRLGNATFTLDGQRRLSQITFSDPAKLPVQLTYYSGAELVKKVSHSDGSVVRYDYYPNGLLKRQYDTGTFDITYQYDSQGRRTRMTTLREGVAVNTDWSYDANTGFPADKKINGATAETYTYRDNGQIATVTDANGVTATHSYNAGGDLTGITYSDATGPLLASSIDRLGRTTKATHAGTTNDYVYTLDGQVMTNAVSGNSLPAAVLSYAFAPTHAGRTASRYVIAGVTQDTALTYDNRALVTSISNSGACITYSYVTNGLLAASAVVSVGGADVLTRTVGWDLAGDRVSNIVFTVNGSNVASYAYTYVTNADRIARITALDGTHWDYQYDDKRQLTWARRYFPDGTECHGLQYGATFDAIGNATAYGSLAASAAPVPVFAANDLNVHVTRAWSNQVEILGMAATNATVTVNSQPTDREGEWFRTLLTINNSSAAVTTNIIVTAVCFDTASSNDIIARATGTLYLAQASESPLYDARASITNDSRYRLAYDALGHLAEVVNTAVTPNVRETYTYFADGRRATKNTYSGMPGSWVNTFTYSFIYDGWNLVHETIIDHLQATTSTRDYLWGLDLAGQRNGRFGQESGGIGGLAVIKAVDSGVTNFYLSLADHNGNILHVVDAATKQIVANYLYAPFGKLVGTWGPKTEVCPFRFQSKYYDVETDLYYFGHRYFNPASAKWMTRDPLAEEGGVNLTAFCRSDPVNNVDPFGESALSWMLGQGCSGEAADAFDLSLGEQLIAIGGGAKQGVKDIFNGNAYHRAVDDTSTIMTRSMDSKGGVWDSTKAISQGVAYQVTSWTGIGGIYESAIGYEVIHQTKLTGMERSSRAMISGGQVILTGVGVGATYNPSATLAGSVQAAKEVANNLGQNTARVARETLQDVSGKEASQTSTLGNSFKGAPLVEGQATIDSVILDDLSGVSFSSYPAYNSTINELGLASRGTSTQIGPRAFSSVGAMRETLLHEELHHRFWMRGIDSPHHPIMNDYMKSVLTRYFKKKGW